MFISIKVLSDLRNVIEGKVVVTNGCFDVLHLGHARMLNAAKRMGDVLIVGLNSDASVRKLKGESRPINCAAHRSEFLHYIAADWVVQFDGVRCDDFLRAARPDIYVKGGDYDLDKLDPSERAALGNAEIKFIPIEIPISTTKILEKL